MPPARNGGTTKGSAMKKTYLTFNYDLGYPAGEDIWYECTRCETSVPSMPEHDAACRCRNISINSDLGLVAVMDAGHVEVFTKDCSPT
jgi:hypothetical protein